MTTAEAGTMEPREVTGPTGRVMVTLDGDDRVPDRWVTYPCDARGILDPVNNPKMIGHPRDRLSVYETGRGPNTTNEWLWPVEVHYDPANNTSRVGWSLAPPRPSVLAAGMRGSRARK